MLSLNACLNLFLIFNSWYQVGLGPQPWALNRGWSVAKLRARAGLLPFQPCDLQARSIDTSVVLIN